MKTMKTQFKVNDYVRVFGRTTKITWIQNEGSDEVEYYNTAVGNYRDGCLDPSGLVEWEPKEGEWCWFWNSYNSSPVLAQFVAIEDDDIDITYIAKVRSNNISHQLVLRNEEFKGCEPLIGELPNFLKEQNV